MLLALEVSGLSWALPTMLSSTLSALPVSPFYHWLLLVGDEKQERFLRRTLGRGDVGTPIILALSSLAFGLSTRHSVPRFR